MFLFLLLLLFTSVSYTQSNPWNDKKSVVVLTYDDALNVHLDNAIPLLDSLNLKATFYLSGYSPGFNERIPEWRRAAENGHELGNHTLFHPCQGNIPGREWVNPVYDLEKYSLQRMVDEIKMANVLFKAVDGKTRRTFAYPCGEMNAGDSSYIELIKSDFTAARGVEGKIETIDTIDLFNIGSFMINGETGNEMINMVKKAMEKKGLILFLFHGVGGEHPLDVSLDAHRELLYYLKQNEKDIWIAPLLEVAAYITNK